MRAKQLCLHNLIYERLFIKRLLFHNTISADNRNKANRKIRQKCKQLSYKCAIISCEWQPYDKSRITSDILAKNVLVSYFYTRGHLRQ